MDRSENLKQMIADGQIEQALARIRSVNGFQQGEEFVVAVLKSERAVPELVEAALEAFLGTRSRQHGFWVHSLSHFTELLWKRRLLEWIRRFNEAAFQGANKLGDDNCCDRLVDDFGKYAQFDDDPAHVGLTPENLAWLYEGGEKKKYITYAVARIEAGSFLSEQALIRWELQRPGLFLDHDYYSQTYLVNAKEIRSRLQRLQELGGDVSEFNGLERQVLEQNLVKLREELASATYDWDKQNRQKGIDRILSALAAL